MIWNDSGKDASGHAWADYIHAQTAEHAPLAEEPGLCEAISNTVADFLANHSGNAPVASDDVNFMVARALWLFGRPELAQGWALNRVRETGSRHFADVAIAEQACLPLWQAAFRSGLLRPLKTELALGESWVLDFAALRRELDCLWELKVFSALDALLERVAFVWDKTNGIGLLGLWHTACIRSKSYARQKAKGVWNSELMGRCTDRLNVLQKRRGWTAAPRVVFLDLS